MTRQETYVVIGAGQAGGRAVEAMRAADFAGRILLVGAENHVPYERPPLSKKLLTGDDGPETTYLHDRAFYEDANIELRLAVQAESIDRDGRTVRLSDGETVSYDKLLLTTGARVRRLTVPGAALPGVHYLRHMDDALAIRSRLVEGARLVIIGGGFIGLEAAAAARSRGCRVTVLEAAGLVMNRVVAPEISRFYEALHRANGVDIITGVAVGEITGADHTGADHAGAEHAGAVICADGAAYPADFVIVGVGIEPNVELAEAAGLDVDNGITVDQYGRASDDNIFAAGDVANHPNAILGRRLRLESWKNAQDQAIAVARVMCGGDEPYGELPWFWSDQYGLNLQMAGMPETWDELVIRGDMETHKFIAFYLSDGFILGANAVNSARDLRFARMLIEARAKPDPAALRDPTVPLKSLL